MKRNKSVLLSVPYIIWMVVFTLIPLGVVGYYALTDPETGVFTWENIKNLTIFRVCKYRLKFLTAGISLKFVYR